MLNRFRPDPSNLKILILSTPKTGNTWLRWLLHYAYKLPIAGLPLEWDEDEAQGLPPSFVTHQHLPPSEGLLRWLVDNRVVVLTTIRHPADTFLSYFHYLRWNEPDNDPAVARLLRDGDQPGRNALGFVEYAFPQAYAVSLAWARLGSHVVRYEDLLVEPVAQLRQLANRIAPLDEERLRTAVLLCKPALLTGPGLVDPRHLRTRTARRWAKELPAELTGKMAAIQPYASACVQYGYDWNPAEPEPVPFDYNAIDPFAGETIFDNGEPIGPSLPRIFLTEVVDARKRWPEPTHTAGDSFWNWLAAPAPTPGIEAGHLPGTLTNLMMSVYRTRPDLQQRYADIVGPDRLAYLQWFVGRAQPEFELPWGLIGPTLDAYCDQMKIGTDSGPARSKGEIVALAIDGHPGSDEPCEVGCGAPVAIDVEFVLAEPVALPVIGLALRNSQGGVVFGTNSTALGTPLPALGAGRYCARLECRLTLPPQLWYVSVGLACFTPDGGVQPIHRRYDFARLNTVGAQGFGAAWCPTTIALRPA